MQALTLLTGNCCSDLSNSFSDHTSRHCYLLSYATLFLKSSSFTSCTFWCGVFFFFLVICHQLSGIGMADYVQRNICCRGDQWGGEGKEKIWIRSNSPEDRKSIFGQLTRAWINPDFLWVVVCFLAVQVPENIKSNALLQSKPARMLV